MKPFLTALALVVWYAVVTELASATCEKLALITCTEQGCYPIVVESCDGEPLGEGANDELEEFLEEEE